MVNQTKPPQTKEIIKMFLVGEAQYVDLNETEQTVEIGFKDNCEGDYDVVTGHRSISVECNVGRRRKVEISNVDVYFTDVRIGSTTQLEKLDVKNNANDKLYLQLGAQEEKQIQGYWHVFKLDEVEEKRYTIHGTKTGNNTNEIQVVNIGFLQGCGHGHLKTIVDSDGTVVQCTRRADILPDELFHTGADFEEPLIGRLGSVRDVALAGQDLGAGFQEKRPLAFNVTVERVGTSGAQDGLKDDDALRTDDGHDSRFVHFIDLSKNSNGLLGGDLNRRGDLSEMELEQQYVVQNLTLRGEGKNVDARHYTVQHVNETEDFQMSRKCRGKIEAMEMVGGVMMKCSVGKETMVINIPGYHKLESNAGYINYVQSDGPAVDAGKMYFHGNGDLIKEMTRVIPGRSGESDVHVLEVMIASHLRYITEDKNNGTNTGYQTVDASFSVGKP